MHVIPVNTRTRRISVASLATICVLTVPVQSRAEIYTWSFNAQSRSTSTGTVKGTLSVPSGNSSGVGTSATITGAPVDAATLSTLTGLSWSFIASLSGTAFVENDFGLTYIDALYRASSGGVNYFLFLGTDPFTAGGSSWYPQLFWSSGGVGFDYFNASEGIVAIPSAGLGIRGPQNGKIYVPGLSTLTSDLSIEPLDGGSPFPYFNYVLVESNNDISFSGSIDASSVSW